jgi:flagellar basal-body rod protein FlgB
MPKLGIFDRTVGLLERALDLRLQNQQVISSNIANADTPGYAPARLEFEEGLKRSLAGSASGITATHGAHFPLGEKAAGEGGAKVVRSADPGVGDRNGVSLDQEMIDLAENQILYEAASQMVSKKLGLLKYVVGGGN